MKRLPNSSNDRLGSQHESPKTPLPLPTIRRLHVVPPSKETARNMPFTPSAIFENMTMLFGLVGLTPIATSDSLPLRWLTSTFCGMLLVGLAALPDKTTNAAAVTAKKLAMINLVRMFFYASCGSFYLLSNRDVNVNSTS